MELRHLQALTAISDHGTFSAAAEHLNTVQSNISAHVARLERELGAPLIDRSDGRLTEEGTVVVARARRILHELDALVSDVAACKDEVTGMDYIPAGQPEPNALGLLMSATMARLLQTLRQDYDLVLLDAPPAQAVTDARIVAGLADATLLCVRWRSTPHSNVLNTLEMLEEAHANVVGAVLTHVDVKVHVRSGYADAEVYHPRYGGYFRE